MFFSKLLDSLINMSSWFGHWHLFEYADLVGGFATTLSWRVCVRACVTGIEDMPVLSIPGNGVLALSMDRVKPSSQITVNPGCLCPVRAPWRLWHSWEPCPACPFTRTEPMIPSKWERCNCATHRSRGKVGAWARDTEMLHEEGEPGRRRAVGEGSFLPPRLPPRCFSPAWSPPFLALPFHFFLWPFSSRLFPPLCLSLFPFQKLLIDSWFKC